MDHVSTDGNAGYDISRIIKSPRYQIAATLLLIWTLFIVSTPALAVGPGTGGSKIRVNDEEYGPYVLLVATSPLPVTVGQMSIWVRVTNAQTHDLQRNAVVSIEATPRNGGPTVTAQGSHKNAGNDFDYVAHLEVDQSGQWDITITVEDELGQAEVSFAETVSRGRSTGALLTVGIPFMVLAIILGIYMWRRSAA